MCGACRGGLPRVPAPVCERCGAPTAWPVARCRECAGRRLAFASARSALVYDGLVRSLVAAWKERGLRGLAAFAGDLTAEAVARPHVDALTPVPADGDRGLRRGHQPAGALARELGRRWDIPVEVHLRRARGGPRQRGLSLADRRRNVADAFVAGASPPRRVALVDDVYTSGATAAAAAQALRRAGAHRVDVVTFARALRCR